VSFPKVNENFSSSEKSAFLDRNLKDAGYGPISWVSSTGSTNADLLEAGLSGAKNLSVLIADHQTMGRGRRNREWLSEENSSLLMSILFRAGKNQGQLGSYSMMISLSACQVLHELGFTSVRIKWPNDLIIHQQKSTSKLAGVLTQTVIQKDQVLVVAGIGVNVRSGNLKKLLPQEEVIALEDIGDPPDRVMLALRVLERIGEIRKDAASIHDEYVSLLDTIGREVRITTDGKGITGTAIAVTPVGALIVDTGDTGREEVFVGDVVHLRA